MADDQDNPASPDEIGFSARRIDPSKVAKAVAPPAARRKPPPDLQIREIDAALDETVADVEGPDNEERGREDEIELDSIFDRPSGGLETASLTRFDPEAGKSEVAIKIRAVTVAVKNTIDTPFGKLVLSIPIFLIGVGLTIAAFTIKDTPYIVAASIVMPVGFVLAYWRYQTWLGHKRYMYRLLETLGEDVSEFDQAKVFRRASDKALARHKRRR